MTLSGTGTPDPTGRTAEDSLTEDGLIQVSFMAIPSHATLATVGGSYQRVGRPPGLCVPQELQHELQHDKTSQHVVQHEKSSQDDNTSQHMSSRQAHHNLSHHDNLSQAIKTQVPKAAEDRGSLDRAHHTASLLPTQVSAPSAGAAPASAAGSTQHTRCRHEARDVEEGRKQIHDEEATRHILDEEARGHIPHDEQATRRILNHTHHLSTLSYHDLVTPAVSVSSHITLSVSSHKEPQPSEGVLNALPGDSGGCSEEDELLSGRGAARSRVLVHHQEQGAHRAAEVAALATPPRSAYGRESEREPDDDERDDESMRDTEGTYHDHSERTQSDYTGTKTSIVDDAKMMHVMHRHTHHQQPFPTPIIAPSTAPFQSSARGSTGKVPRMSVSEHLKSAAFMAGYDDEVHHDHVHHVDYPNECGRLGVHLLPAQPTQDRDNVGATPQAPAHVLLVHCARSVGHEVGHQMAKEAKGDAQDTKQIEQREPKGSSHDHAEHAQESHDALADGIPSFKSTPIKLAVGGHSDIKHDSLVHGIAKASCKASNRRDLPPLNVHDQGQQRHRGNEGQIKAQVAGGRGHDDRLPGNDALPCHDAIPCHDTFHTHALHDTIKGHDVHVETHVQTITNRDIPDKRHSILDASKGLVKVPLHLHTNDTPLHLQTNDTPLDLHSNDTRLHLHTTDTPLSNANQKKKKKKK